MEETEKPKPPLLANWLIAQFVNGELYEEFLGDLEEIYQERVLRHGTWYAWWLYWVDVLHLLLGFSSLPRFTYNPTDMFNHYMKISWRNLLKNKGYSLINVSGLGVGMAVALLIGLWIHYEMNVDAFHQSIDRIGILRKHTLFNDTKDTQLSVPVPLYDVLSNDYPEIKHITRFKSSTTSLMADERKVQQTGQYVDSDFLEIFSFPLIKGNHKTALNDPQSIVLTESLAEILFGDDDPMGKVVRINNEYDAQVAGVMNDIPENSFFSYITFLAPFEYTLANSYLQRFEDNWGSNVIWTLLEVNEGVSMDAFSEKISLINQKNDPASP